MNEAEDLTALLRAALVRADADGETLVAALLAECVDVIERRASAASGHAPEAG